MDANKSNKRRATRVTFDTEVSIKTKAPQRVTLAESKNISVNGLYVTTDEEFPVGTPCEINIQLGDNPAGPCIKIKGKVVRKDSKGVGISFESVDLDSFIHLKNVVRYNSDDADAIEDESIV